MLEYHSGKVEIIHYVVRAESSDQGYKLLAWQSISGTN